MHFIVKPTNLCVDEHSSAKRGLNWFDEKQRPKVKENLDKIMKKFPEDIEVV